MNRVFIPFVLILCLACCCISCFNENTVDALDEDVSISLDTLRFDTVFTTIGSVTRQFKIYNRSPNNIFLQSVRLSQAGNSKFRINVDGFSSDSVEDILVLANDSIYIFVEVTIDPDEPLSISPFIITESLIISTANGQKTVVLEAWGQNANYFPSKNAKGTLNLLTCNNGTVIWNDPKPYVIYGLLFIDSCGLFISPGTQIYVHGGLGRIDDGIFNDGGFLFLNNGFIQSQGSLEAPVVFQGDRLETEYQDVAGQWTGIRLLSESDNNAFTHTIIRNSIIGIRADSASSVSIKSCEIYNTSNVGVIGINANISVDNSLIYSNGAQSMAFVSGGNYQIRQTTIANYLNQAPALYADNFTCLDSDCISVEVNPINISIENCIIMGSNSDELDLNDFTNGEDPDAFRMNIASTIIRVDELKATFSIDDYCNNCIEYSIGQKVFLDEDELDFHLDSSSIALDKGLPVSVELSVDLDGKTRDLNNPDLGCYESDF